MSLIEALEEMEKFEEREDRIALAIPDASGDLKYIWDVNDPQDVEFARKMFEELRAKGRVIFRVGNDAEKTTEMKTFDPEAGKLIAGRYVAAPAMRGG